MDGKLIGANLKAIRKGRGLTQQQLGDMLGMTRTNVGMIEAGQSLPPLRKLMGYAQKLGVSMDELINGCKPVITNQFFVKGVEVVTGRDGIVIKQVNASTFEAITLLKEALRFLESI